MRHVRGRKQTIAQAEYLARLEHLARQHGETVADSAANKMFYRGLTPSEALTTNRNVRSVTP